MLFILPHFLLLTFSYFCSLSLKRKVAMLLSFATEALNRKGRTEFRYLTVRRSERWWLLSCCGWRFTPTIPQVHKKLPCDFIRYTFASVNFFSASSESSRRNDAIFVMFLSDVCREIGAVTVLVHHKPRSAFIKEFSFL